MRAIKQINPLYHWKKEEEGVASIAGTAHSPGAQAQGAGWPQVTLTGFRVNLPTQL